MLVVSAPLFAYYTDALARFSIPTDPFLKLFSPSAKQDYDNLHSAQLIALVFLVGGFVSLGCGIAARGQRARPLF